VRRSHRDGKLVSPFSKLAGKSQYFDFFRIDSANITYKLLKELNHVDLIGPIMLGMGKPVHIFNWEQVWKKWLIWLPLPLLMLKKSRRKKIRQF
jgi:malate dehydrogenase (oxaloacetate-decarboxylating)(NADP+)